MYIKYVFLQTMSSKKELQTVFEELIETKKNMFIDVLREVYDMPHNFVFVNINSQWMFKNFDELSLCKINKNGMDLKK